MTPTEREVLETKTCIRCKGKLTKSTVKPRPELCPPTLMGRMSKQSWGRLEIWTCMNQCGVGFLFTPEGRYEAHCWIINHGYAYRTMKLLNQTDFTQQELYDLWLKEEFARFIPARQFILQFQLGMKYKQRDLETARVVAETKKVALTEKEKEHLSSYNALPFAQ